MNIFSWLLLGHLLADWLLQSDWMAIGKRQGLVTLPGLAHFTIYTVIILLIFFFFPPVPPHLSNLLTAGLLIFVSHWLIDGTNLVQTWMRFCGQRDQSFVRIMIDQTLHLLVLGLISLI